MRHLSSRIESRKTKGAPNHRRKAAPCQFEILGLPVKGPPEGLSHQFAPGSALGTEGGSVERRCACLRFEFRGSVRRDRLRGHAPLSAGIIGVRAERAMEAELGIDPSGMSSGAFAGTQSSARTPAPENPATDCKGSNSAGSTALGFSIVREVPRSRGFVPGIEKAVRGDLTVTECENAPKLNQNVCLKYRRWHRHSCLCGLTAQTGMSVPPT